MTAFSFRPSSRLAAAGTSDEGMGVIIHLRFRRYRPITIHVSTVRDVKRFDGSALAHHAHHRHLIEGGLRPRTLHAARQ